MTVTTRIPVPSTTHQTALNVSSMAGKAAMCLNGTTSYQSLVQAEVMMKRSLDDARALMGQIKTLKRQAMEAERKALEDRNVLLRQGEGV